LKVLVTGGAGFIGSRISKEMYRRGNNVTVVDNFNPQVHGDKTQFDLDLTSIANCVVGDVNDQCLVQDLVRGQDVVIHMAAETGTGQSMYEIKKYCQINILGTANILEAVLKCQNRTVQKVIVASSRSIYGEGQYHCDSHGIVFPNVRSVESLSAGIFDPLCPICGGIVISQPTAEDSPCSPSSLYGLTKQVQEQMVLMFARSIGISAFALRYQNVFGPGQSLINPYTGILAVFSNLARQNKPINIFEDGNESRDFVFINDVVRATCDVADEAIKGIDALNVGSSVRTSVLDVAKSITTFFNSKSEIRISGEYRIGDIRHNSASLKKIENLISYKSETDFEEGLAEFLQWASLHQVSVSDAYEKSIKELRGYGLFGDKS
jgi:dTDP-L-rhamnose 4-epimerase